MIWLLFLVFLIYAVLIVTLAIGFRKGKEFTAKESGLKTTFSVIIPFRNEANVTIKTAYIKNTKNSNQIIC